MAPDPTIGISVAAREAGWMERFEGALWLGGSLALAVAAGLLAHAVLRSVLRGVAERTNRASLRSLVNRLSGPTRLALPLFGVQFVLVAAAATSESALMHMASKVATLAIILTMTWATVCLVGFVADVLKSRHRVDVSDNLVARRIHTQVGVLARCLGVVLWIVGIAIGLMTFPQVRQVGASLLASAGIAGIILGVAARPIAENLLAGVQIAFTEPIRLDDVVVIEGQWGRIEEITPTYVVVRIWDDRRLVVPLMHFITKPVENWTRTTSQILGTVFLYTDYTVSVSRLREELKRILDGSDKWDRRGWALQVTDAKASTIEIRALMSAVNGPTAFELRCEVREKLIDFLQREYPEALPRTRAVLEQRGDAAAVA